MPYGKPERVGVILRGRESVVVFNDETSQPGGSALAEAVAAAKVPRQPGGHHLPSGHAWAAAVARHVGGIFKPDRMVDSVGDAIVVPSVRG